MRTPRLFEELEKAEALLLENSHSVEYLYANWWSQGKPTLKIHLRETKYHESRALRQLVKHDHAWVVGDGFRAYKVYPGEYLDNSDKFFQIIRRKTWDSEYWSWVQSEMIEPYPNNESKIRVYVPTPSNVSLEELLGLLISTLEAKQLWFVLKHRHGNGGFSDHFVIWIQQSVVPVFFEEFARYGNIYFKGLPPPLTIHHHGLGIAFDPLDGESFGWLMCQEISRAVINGSQAQLADSIQNQVIRLSDLVDWTSS